MSRALSIIEDPLGEIQLKSTFLMDLRYKSWFQVFDICTPFKLLFGMFTFGFIYVESNEQSPWTSCRQILIYLLNFICWMIWRFIINLPLKLRLIICWDRATWINWWQQWAREAELREQASELFRVVFLCVQWGKGTCSFEEGNNAFQKHPGLGAVKKSNPTGC